MNTAEALALLKKWKDLSVKVSGALHVPRGQPYKARAQVDGLIVVLDENTLLIGSEGGSMEVVLRGCTFSLARSNQPPDDMITADIDETLTISLPTGEICFVMGRRPLN